jgi:hypothetical protein
LAVALEPPKEVILLERPAPAEEPKFDPEVWLKLFGATDGPPEEKFRPDEDLPAE